MGRRVLARSVGLIVVAILSCASCGQLIGSDKTRKAAPSADDDAGIDAGDAGDSGVTMTMRDAAVPPNKNPPPCPTGQKKCDGACVSIDDPAYGCGLTTCAQCSVAFAATTKCSAGACAVATCTAGHADCNERNDDGCEADLSDPATCGNCKTACGGAQQFCTPFGSCTADCGTLTACGTTCVDLTQGSPKHCGSCDHVCPNDPKGNGDAVCTNALCGITCHGGFADCDKTTLGCEPLIRSYADTDGDGYGAGAFTETCTVPAGRVTNASDCVDTNAAVHPLQAAYFGSGYSVSGVTSFDYDCSGGEEGDPSQQKSIGCNPCSTGYGAAAVMRVPNARCGSTVFNSCTAELTNVCMPIAPPAGPYRCR